MNYQVLARKWRPSNFTEVIGQEHVVKSLMNALQHERLHHAYLFTGTRGVGKTTLARILAKAVNCEQLTSSNPCGICKPCRELDEGRFLDLIEVDAASRTKVEDTRDLLDNVQYAPHYGRYKVYLIDEVHMLSGHSFNALLKTLEEPPPHVKFLLATTDPQKIPVTVLSRCLQLNLKRLSSVQISAQMTAILAHELINNEPQAVHILARAADGSMRDGLSLLDQAIVYGGGEVTTSSVNDMLGTVGLHSIKSLLLALADSDAMAVLKHIADIANVQSDFSTVLQQLLQAVHRMALAQKVPEWVDDEYDSDMLTALSQRFTPEDLQLYYQIGLLGLKDVDLAPDSRMGFEMVMLRMLAFKPVSANEEQPLTLESSGADLQRHTSINNDLLSPSQLTPAIADRMLSQPATNKNSSLGWSEQINVMKLEGLTRELANNCLLESINEHSCLLILDANRQQLLTANSEKKLRQAIQDYYGAPLKIDFKIAQPQSETPAMQSAKAVENRQQAAVDAINTDATVNALKEHFDARIIPGSIQPV